MKVILHYHIADILFFRGNSLQAIFGMGVKNVFKLHTYEIHSTFGMILTSFGFIGFLIFYSYDILDIRYRILTVFEQ